MAKKKQTKKINKIDPKERFLLVLIDASEKAITNQGTAIDDFFRHQADRLRTKLAAVKLANSLRSGALRKGK